MIFEESDPKNVAPNPRDAVIRGDPSSVRTLTKVTYDWLHFSIYRVILGFYMDSVLLQRTL